MPGFYFTENEPLGVEWPHVGYGGREPRSYLDSDFQLSVGKWYLIHQVIFKDRVKVYVNAKQVTDESIDEISLNNDKPIMIGGNYDKQDFYFRGDIYLGF